MLTLGLWMPAEVRYHCKAPADAGGSIPARPASDAGAFRDTEGEGETMANGRNFFRKKTQEQGRHQAYTQPLDGEYVFGEDPGTKPPFDTYKDATKELQAIIKACMQDGKRLRARGSLWSLSTAAVTDGRLIDTTTLRVALEVPTGPHRCRLRRRRRQAALRRVRQLGFRAQRLSLRPPACRSRPPARTTARPSSARCRRGPMAAPTSSAPSPRWSSAFI